MTLPANPPLKGLLNQRPKGILVEISCNTLTKPVWPMKNIERLMEQSWKHIKRHEEAMA